MKNFLKKDIPSVLFVLSITLFGLFLALILFGLQNYNQKLGSYIGMASMFLISISLFITISKKNKK